MWLRLVDSWGEDLGSFWGADVAPGCFACAWVWGFVEGPEEDGAAEVGLVGSFGADFLVHCYGWVSLLVGGM